MCFEIPESYLGNSGGGWYVSYENLESAPYFSDAVQEVPYAQNDVDAQEQYEAAVLSQYNSVGPLSLENAMIVQDLYGNAPLTAVALFDTEAPCNVTVTVHGKNPEADITYTVGDVVTQHQVPIFGLYAGMENRVTITAGEESTDHYITTAPIPEDINVEVCANQSNNTTEIADGQLYLMQEVYHTIFDKYGDVRWYMYGKFTQNNAVDNSGSFTIDSDRGGFWFSFNPTNGWVYSGNTEFIHMSWTGKVLQQFSYQDKLCSHDATILPDGKILNYATHSSLFLIDPETGAMSEYFNFAEYLDPSIGNINPENGENRSDWQHVNTVEYIAENNSILVSLRNQLLVMNIAYDTKEVLWAMTPAYSKVNGEIVAKQPVLNDLLILPNEDDTDFEWFYSQHDPSFVSYDAENQVFEFVVFDNGSRRYVYGEEPNNLEYTRIVHYAVDLNTRTATQLFQYGKEEGKRLYSVGYGSADKIAASGNYLGCFRGQNEVYPNSSIIVEVDEKGQVVAEFEIKVSSDNWGIYRVNPLFLGDSSFSNCNFGENSGIWYFEYDQSTWEPTENVGTSSEQFSEFQFSEFYSDSKYLYTYGTAKPFKIRLVHQDFKDLFPNSFVSPPTESLIYGSPFPVARRQVPPRCSCAQNPENTVDKSAIVFSDAAPLATLPRQVRFQQLPCSVTYVVPLLFVRHGNTSLSFCAPIILYYSCKHYLSESF